jgi:GAF domain-containing protein
MQPLLPSKEVGLMGVGDIKFFESGLALIEGEGDLRGALTQLIQLAAEGANSNSASFYVIDAQEKVLKPLVTYGLPAAYVEACGNVRVGDQCCGRAVEHRKPWIVSDMIEDPLFASAKSAALVSPIRAGFSVPVISADGECVGARGASTANVIRQAGSRLSATKLGQR